MTTARVIILGFASLFFFSTQTYVAAARKIKRAAFWFNLPTLSKNGLPGISLPEVSLSGVSLSGVSLSGVSLSGDSKDKVEALVAKVKSIRKSGRALIITLENGQIWKKVDGRLNYVPKDDLAAAIRPQSVGRYMISLNNVKTIMCGLRVRRIE